MQEAQLEFASQAKHNLSGTVVAYCPKGQIIEQTPLYIEDGKKIK